MKSREMKKQTKNKIVAGVMTTAFALSLLSPYQAEAGVLPSQQWIKSLGTSSAENLFDATPAHDGGYVAVGRGFGTYSGFTHKGQGDAMIVKMDMLGNQEWIKSMGGSLEDRFEGVTKTSDGGFVAVGYSGSTDAGFTNKGNHDAIIVKYDANGNQKWLKTVGGSDVERFISVTETADGGYVAVGFSNSLDAGFVNNVTYAGSEQKGLLVKFDANGNQKWIKGWGDENNRGAIERVKATPDGGFIAVSPHDIMKFDVNGNQVWRKPMSSSSKTSYHNLDIIPLKNGGYAISGYALSAPEYTNKGGYDSYVAKLDSFGNILWIKFWGGASHDTFNSLSEDKNGNLLAVGTSYSTEMTGSKGLADGILAKYDSNGVLQGTARYGGSNNDHLESIIPTTDGTGHLAVGYFFSTNAGYTSKGGSDGVAIKLSESNPPVAPTFKATTTTLTNQDVQVTITYPVDSVKNEYRINGGAWTVYSSPVVMTANGLIEARATNANGEVSSVSSYNVSNVDKTAPVTPSITPSTTSPTNGNVLLTATFPSDATIKEYRINGGSWTAYTGSVTMTANGTFEARGKDSAGNYSNISTYSVGNIDKVAPTTPTLTPSTTAPTDLSVTVTISYPNDAVLKEYRVNGGAWKMYTSPVAMDANGTIEARAKDQAGNYSTSGTLTVSNIKEPTPPSETGDVVNDAEEAVSYAEQNITQENVDHARDKVEIIPVVAPEYEPLKERVEDLQEYLDVKVAIKEATESRLIEDIEEAKGKIDLLNSNNPVIIDLLDEVQEEFEVADIMSLVVKERYDILSTKYQMSKEAYHSLLYTYYAIKYTGDNMYKFAKEKVELVQETDKYYQLVHEQYNNLFVDYEEFKQDRIATDAEIKAESSVQVMEKSYDPTHAVNTQTLINAVEDDTVRASLQQRLDSAKAKYQSSLLVKTEQEAVTAVEKAESTKQSYYVSEAYKKVNYLTNAELKFQLTNRLQALEAQMALDKKIADATRTVELAEQYKYQSYIDSAQTKVTALPDGEVKTSLQTRLDALKAGLPTSDQATVIKQATNYVSLAQSLKTQYYVDKAQGYINQIIDPVKKAELQAKLDAIVVK